MRESAARSRYRHSIIPSYRLIARDHSVARTCNATGNESTPSAVGTERYNSSETIDSRYLNSRICNNTSIDSNARRTGHKSEVLDREGHSNRMRQ